MLVSPAKYGNGQGRISTAALPSWAVNSCVCGGGGGGGVRVCVTVCLSVCLSVCLFVCLSIFCAGLGRLYV